MSTILHISADFPDPLEPRKTRAVDNLLAASGGFRHVVYSLNRADWRQSLSLVPFGEDRTAIAYPAPPYGIALARCLKPVSAAILRDLIARGIRPDVIHAHKFTVEGLVAADLARDLQRPFICSLWGDTDGKIFDVKLDLRARYREVAHKSALLLAAAPWTARRFHAALRLPPEKIRVLPVITAGDAIITPLPGAGPHLVSVFSLDSWKRKNLPLLVKAAQHAAREHPGLTLDIYGSGRETSVAAAKAVVQKVGVPHRVRLMGALPHDSVQRTMNRYAGFAMAPRRETYGMVHVEAVLAGLPVLWSRERGIDGLLPDRAVGYRANPNSVRDVARGLCFLIDNEMQIKTTIAAMQRGGAFDHLRRQRIAGDYTAILNDLARAEKRPLRLSRPPEPFERSHRRDLHARRETGHDDSMRAISARSRAYRK